MRSQDGLHCETNSLSRRERARVRGKAVCNGQGLGALPGVELCFPSLIAVEVTGSSPARGFAERFFPLTPALSPRRGRTVRCAFANPERLDSSPRDMRCSPTLRERERGEWEIRDRFQAMFSRLSPLPGPLPARCSRGEEEEEAPRAPLAFVAYPAGAPLECSHSILSRFSPGVWHPKRLVCGEGATGEDRDFQDLARRCARREIPGLCHCGLRGHGRARRHPPNPGRAGQ